MRKLREIARLRFEAGRTFVEIASSVGVARSSVQLALQRLRAAGLSWPWPEGVDDVALDARLFPRPAETPPSHLPDFTKLRAELSRKGVTRMLLWREYREVHPDGFAYSQFCERFRQWRKVQDVVLRMDHAPGDKLFVDYAGMTMPVIDARTGEVREVQIFVAAFGHSGYTFVEATATQTMMDWFGSHRRAFTHFGGVPAAVVPDNLKSGVTRSHRYDPDINAGYQDLAEHYGFAVLPARPLKPRDKATVEGAVLIIERTLLAPLRDRQFFSIAELNDALRPLCAALNQQPFQKREHSRQVVFDQVERAALKPLPAGPYDHAIWKEAKVHLDYHVEHDRRYYSVPYVLTGKRVSLRIAEQTVEIFHLSQRVATHAKGRVKGQFTTDPAHRPPHHQSIVDSTHQRLVQQAVEFGESVAAVVRAQSDRRRHPDQTLRSTQGILRLAKDYSVDALEIACRRALGHKTLSYRAIVALLKAPPPPVATPTPPIEHDNLRGPHYFLAPSPC